MRHWTWWLGIFLGGLLIAAGVAETIRLTRSGDGGLVFWFGTLVGGGALVLAGTLLMPRRPVPGLVMTGIGCLLGLLPTAWTLVVPVLLLTLLIASAKRVSEATGPQPP
ncbi:MAG TPA: hypothetical protein VLI04_14515 [Nocardioidaceae bacterium]|nr:hypothetical protein [Nocardioidaceae bacterium]